MHRPHIRGRNRLLTQPMKVKLCELVAESATIEQAAETLDVSVRTVQRERKDDEDFDHQLRLSLQAAPDPQKLMESAARTHWRAAAWLLERSDPERFGRRPISSASPQQVEAALKFVTEAALNAAAPERQNETYDQVRAACDHAFKCLFPNVGPWGSAKNPKIPPTPLADKQEVRQVLDYARAHIVPDLDEQGNVLPIVLPAAPAPPTAEELAQAQAHAELRARYKEKLRQEREAEAIAAATALNKYEGILSPKIDVATKCKPAPTRSTHSSPRTGRFSDQSAPVPSAASVETESNDPHAKLVILDEQLRQAARRRRETLLSRKTRAATKRRKTLKKRARRNELVR